MGLYPGVLIHFVAFSFGSSQIIDTDTAKNATCRFGTEFIPINHFCKTQVYYRFSFYYDTVEFLIFLLTTPSAMVKNGSYKSNTSDNPDRVRKNSNMRDRSTINRMHMYREGKAKYDRNGKLIGGYLRSTTKTGNKEIEGPARIAPNRKWFGNTRTITPEKLDTFREEMAKTVNDPYQRL